MVTRIAAILTACAALTLTGASIAHADGPPPTPACSMCHGTG